MIESSQYILLKDVQNYTANGGKTEPNPENLQIWLLQYVSRVRNTCDLDEISLLTWAPQTSRGLHQAIPRRAQDQRRK